MEPDARRAGRRDRRLAHPRDARATQTAISSSTAATSLIAGDTLLTPITPAIGLYPESRPDPLGDYLDSLRLVAELAPRISYGGHGEAVVDPVARCAAIADHHAERLDRTEAALGGEPRSGYDVSHDLFGSTLAPIQRRFAVAEALSHLERLVVARAGAANRGRPDRHLYCANSLVDDLPSSTSTPLGCQGVTLTLELIGVGLLVLLNGFFVAAEYALVTARRTRIIELHHQGNRRARAVLRITSDPPQFITAMQLGVTLTSLGIGALGEHALSKAFDTYMATLLAVILAYLILTFFHVVIGELVPKGLALGHAEGTALWVSAPVRAFFALTAPLIWFLRKSTDAVLHVLGLEPPGAEREPLSEAELRMLLSRSSAEGEIEHEEQQMIDKVFVFGDKEAADVMVPRPEVVAVSVALPPEQALKAVLESPYTRYPSTASRSTTSSASCTSATSSPRCTTAGIADVRLEEIVRPAYIVPETKDLASLLQEFRKTNNHFAVVVDEYGGMAGICTLEDLLEEIVGEIEDEFDVPEEQIEQVDDDTYRVDGMFPIDEFNERFGTDMPDDDYHTIGGFVFGQLGRAAEPGDDVSLGRHALRRPRGRRQPHRESRRRVHRAPAASSQ